MTYGNPKSGGFRTVAVLAATGSTQSGFVVAVSGINSFDAPQKDVIQGYNGSGEMGTMGWGVFDASTRYLGHAETKVLDYAYDHFMNPSALVASRPFCPNCRTRITNSGGTIYNNNVAGWLP